MGSGLGAQPDGSVWYLCVIPIREADLWLDLASSERTPRTGVNFKLVTWSVLSFSCVYFSIPKPFATTPVVETVCK